jgi:hypothetical protein
MAKLTLSEILADIDTRLPNIFTETQKINWLNMVARKYYKYAPHEVELPITLTSGIGSYCTDSSDGFKFENLNYVKFYNTTAAVSSTDVASYELYGKDAIYEHGQAGSFLYDSSGSLGISPVPTTSGYRAIVNYNKYPATLTTDNSTTYPDIMDGYEEILVFGTMQIMAKSGISPDIDIANNAQADLSEVLSQARLELSRKKYKARGRNRVSYKEIWENEY